MSLEHPTGPRVAIGDDIERRPGKHAASDVAAERQISFDADRREREVQRVAGIEIDHHLLFPLLADEVRAHRVRVGHVHMQARAELLGVERLDRALDWLHRPTQPTPGLESLDTAWWNF